MAELTPMMQQYHAVKQQHPDCLLFFRLGDFYEMFEEDARIAARVLDLTLTTRDRSKEKSDEEKVPMCGVPYHASDTYVARLVSCGYKVAICEQMEDPALAKGLVKRAVIRIITPGSVTESTMLEESKNNYYACVFAPAGMASASATSPRAPSAPRSSPAPTRRRASSMSSAASSPPRRCSAAPPPRTPPCRTRCASASAPV